MVFKETLYIVLTLYGLDSLRSTNAFRNSLSFVPRYKSISGLTAVSTPMTKDVHGEIRENSRKVSLLNKIGFKRLSEDDSEWKKEKKGFASSSSSTTTQFNVTTLPELDSYFADEEMLFRNDKGEIDYDALLRALYVHGDTQIIGCPDRPDFVHPVAKLLHERKRNKSVCTPGKRADGCRVALVVEGGGMRGCVSAGMVCAIDHLGLRDAVDVVYGSSAGSIVGAYFITGQLPWFGPEIYYDKLTTAGKNFIDTKRLLRALGFGLLDPRLLRDVLTRPSGKPVLNLSYLLKKSLQQTKKLDWKKFKARQNVQPLKVVASGLKSQQVVSMSMANGSFESLEELAESMHASCLLPGLAGPVMNINKQRREGHGKPKFVLGNNLESNHYEPLGDALLYGPIPYEEALKDGATHVIVLRTRPDGTDVTGKGGVFERMIFRRFFLRKNKLPGPYEHLRKHLHKKLYAENVITLNEHAKSMRSFNDASTAHMLAIALPPGSKEVSRLETGREAIFEGVRRGFARAYDALVEDPVERGRGKIVAKEYFPDEILDYDPLDIPECDDKSAFDLYLAKSGITPKSRNSVKK